MTEASRVANQRNRAPPVRGAAGQPLLQTIPGPTQEWASISLQVVGLSELVELFEVLFVDLAKKLIASFKVCLKYFYTQLSSPTQIEIGTSAVTRVLLTIL